MKKVNATTTTTTTTTVTTTTTSTATLLKLVKHSYLHQTIDQDG